MSTERQSLIATEITQEPGIDPTPDNVVPLRRLGESEPIEEPMFTKQMGIFDELDVASRSLILSVQRYRARRTRGRRQILTQSRIAVMSYQPLPEVPPAHKEYDD